MHFRQTLIRKEAELVSFLKDNRVFLDQGRHVMELLIPMKQVRLDKMEMAHLT